MNSASEDKDDASDADDESAADDSKALDEDTESRYMNSGVQRCQILAIVEDVPESNYNLRLILEKLMTETALCNIVV